ncbi:TPA: hypothetical protein I7181_22690, partial [Vibrio vulnificus]|nr:hypothetical protein [Vibrio vulnificus]HAT8516458.1 hypothetical protein [Vibrio vulnificus]
MSITSIEVKELTEWLHKDVDESVEDAGSLDAFKKYSRIYQCLGLLQSILELEESNEDYQCMLGYSDNNPDVKCMVANVVGNNLVQVNEQSKNDMQLKDWFMSYIDDKNQILVQGPFKTMTLAMEKAKDMLDITVFRSPFY